MLTVAQQLVDVIRQAEVRRIYGLVGDSLNPIVDAVRRTEDLDWVHVRNEEAAAFAAGADAELTGRLAVCAGSCGPGNTHLVQGLYDAHRNGAPVLAIASHIPQAQIGTQFFQETHPEALFAECSSYCELVSSPEQMPRVLRIAIQHALGEGGVAVIVLPGDVAERAATVPTGESVLGLRPPTVVPHPDAVAELAAAMNAAQKVTLYCGAGCRDAREDVLALADALKAPVGHALGGKEWIQVENPHDVGMNGLLGYGACWEATHQADLLVLLGTDFPYDAFLPDDVPTAQVDVDPTRIGRRTRIQVGVQGDVGATIRALLPQLRERTDRSFLDAMLKRHAHLLEKVVGAYTQRVETKVPIHPEYVAAQLDELAADDAIFTVDTGMNNVWAARYLTPNGRRRVIGSWRHGTMANALPHAVGAQAAFPGRQVVSLSGDGGLAMLMGELLTPVLHHLPVKVVLMDNSSLGMVKLEMLVEGIPDHETDHAPVDFGAIAVGAGWHVVRIEDPRRVTDGLREVLAHDGPALAHLITDPNALSIPPHVTLEQTKGFALAAGKVVLEGGVGRMIDLARANLRNVPRG